MPPNDSFVKPLDISIIVPMISRVGSVANEIGTAVSLCRHHRGACDIIIVTRSGHEPETAIASDKHSGNIRYVDFDGDDDFNHACWIGAEAARNEILLFLHPAIQISPQSLSAMLRYFRHPDTFGVSPLISSSDGRIAEACLQIPHIQKKHIRLRNLELDKVIASLPRPLITLRNVMGAMLLNRSKLMEILSVQYQSGTLENVCVSAWLKNWRCYSAVEARGFVSCNVEDMPGLFLAAAEKIKPVDLSATKKLKRIGEVITYFETYYDRSHSARFKTVIGLPRRKTRHKGPVNSGALEDNAAKRLGCAFTDSAILDIGCGLKKFPGATGMDMYPGQTVDLVHNLDSIPWPIREESFDLVIASHIFEHVQDFGGVLLEAHRILRPEGTLIVRCPHFSSRDSYRNPTHVRHLSYESITEMLVQEGESMQHDLSCGRAPFILIQTQLKFMGGTRAKLGRFLANRNARAWEQYWSRILPARETCWQLRKQTVAKDLPVRR